MQEDVKTDVVAGEGEIVVDGEVITPDQVEPVKADVAPEPVKEEIVPVVEEIAPVDPVEAPRAEADVITGGVVAEFVPPVREKFYAGKKILFYNGSTAILEGSEEHVALRLDVYETL